MKTLQMKVQQKAKRITQNSTRTDIWILLQEKEKSHDPYIEKNLPSQKIKTKAERVSIWIFPESWKF